MCCLHTLQLPRTKSSSLNNHCARGRPRHKAHTTARCHVVLTCVNSFSHTPTNGDRFQYKLRFTDGLSHLLIVAKTQF